MFVALALVGSLHWMAMLEPAATARAWYAVGAGALTMLGLLAAGRLPGAATDGGRAATALIASRSPCSRAGSRTRCCARTTGAR